MKSRKRELPKAELLISATPKRGGVEGPFIRVTGFWGRESEKITKHLGQLGIIGDMQVPADLLPEKMKLIYETLKADSELAVEEQEHPFMYGLTEIVVSVL